jgi:phage shock protein E
MDWSFIIIAGVVVVVFFGLKRLSFVSATAARKHLAEGALVIDVRSPEEFRGGHIPQAINVPLGELRERIPCHVSDKNQVLLLHCLSGGRSGIAKHQLKRLGYPNVFNLGSYGRANQIVTAKAQLTGAGGPQNTRTTQKKGSKK